MLSRHNKKRKLRRAPTNADLVAVVAADVVAMAAPSLAMATRCIPQTRAVAARSMLRTSRS
jgi:hypothetical protein